MADSNLPESERPIRTPDPHRDEPTPLPDAHTRPEAEGVIRPDQQESDLGPIGELMGTAPAEATTEVAADMTGDPAAEATAQHTEAEGVESAQIFSIMLATAVTLGLAVFGVFFLVAYVADNETVERDAVGLYPELQETRARAAAKLSDYGREEEVYQMPIDAAMASVAETYAARQGDAAVPAPQNYSMVYLDANTADRLGLEPVGSNEAFLPTQEPDLATEEENGPADEAATEVSEDRTEEPEDR